jgi:hypothetical protein
MELARDDLERKRFLKMAGRGIGAGAAATALGAFIEAQFYDEVAQSELFHGTTLAMLKRFGAEEHAHVTALKGVATKLGMPAAKPLAAAGSIVQIEARHAAAIGLLIHKPVTPDGPFDVPLSKSKVLAKAGPLISKG